MDFSHKNRKLTPLNIVMPAVVHKLDNLGRGCKIMSKPLEQKEVNSLSEEIPVISSYEWIKKGQKLFGLNTLDWKFVCPNCGNIQTPQDLMNLNKGFSRDECIERCFYSCIGRYIEGTKGTIENQIKPCNYTLGGLFDFSKVKVRFKSNIIPVFEFAGK